MTEKAAETNAPKTIVEQIDALFAPWNRNDAPGMTVGVVKDGTLVYRRGFGMASLETSVANTPKTRMRIASVTKHFTALLVLLLAEEGKLDLDRPVRTYLPELSGANGEPSLRLLLQHRGGQRTYCDVAALCRGNGYPPLGESFAAQIRQKGRNFSPGEAMIYNNGAYHMMSIVIERAGVGSFETQLKERFFDLLGMTDSEAVPSDFGITPGMATMHVPAPGGGWRRGLFPYDEDRGEGAIVSTVDDLLRWTAHLRIRDKFGTPSTWAQLTERPVFPDGSVGYYTLGLMLQTYRGLPTLRHSGGAIGGTAEMLTFPEHGLDVAILANGAPGANVSKLAQGIADILLEHELGERRPEIRAADYQDLLGEWWSPETEMIYGLVEEEGNLRLIFCTIPYSTPLERETDGRVHARMDGMGPVRVDIDKPTGGALTIAFGGHAHAYRKLSKDAADRKTFAQAAVGRYRSEDGNCIATIREKGADIVATFGDPYGQIETTLTVWSDRVASTTAALPNTFHHSALTFDSKDGTMTGFRLNSSRTRNLEFERI